MIRTYHASASAADPDSSAARGLRAAIARRAQAKAPTKPTATAKPAPVASAPKPAAKWSPELAASPAARAMTQRAIDVAGSPHFEGNRDLAVQLLGNAKLSGAEIVACLALAGSQTEAEADAALADMKGALADASQRNTVTASAIGTGPSRAAKIWETAYTRTFGEEGE